MFKPGNLLATIAPSLAHLDSNRLSFFQCIEGFFEYNTPEEWVRYLHESLNQQLDPSEWAWHSCPMNEPETFDRVYANQIMVQFVIELHAKYLKYVQHYNQGHMSTHQPLAQPAQSGSHDAQS